MGWPSDFVISRHKPRNTASHPHPFTCHLLPPYPLISPTPDPLQDWLSCILSLQNRKETWGWDGGWSLGGKVSEASDWIFRTTWDRFGSADLESQNPEDGCSHPHLLREYKASLDSVQWCHKTKLCYPKHNHLPELLYCYFFFISIIVDPSAAESIWKWQQSNDYRSSSPGTEKSKELGPGALGHPFHLMS